MIALSCLNSKTVYSGAVRRGLEEGVIEEIKHPTKIGKILILPDDLVLHRIIKR
jgi:hypothetical protein